MSTFTHVRTRSLRAAMAAVAAGLVALVGTLWMGSGPASAAPGDISGVLFPDCRVIDGELVNAGWQVLLDNTSSSDQTVTVDGVDVVVPADAYGYAVPVSSGSPSVTHAGQPVTIDEGPAGCDIGYIVIFGYYQCDALDPPGFAVVSNSSLTDLTGTITGGGAPDQTVTVPAGGDITVGGYSFPPQFVVAGSTIDASLFDVDPATCDDHLATSTTAPEDTTTTTPEGTTTTAPGESTTAPSATTTSTSPVVGPPLIAPAPLRPRFTG